MHAPCVGPDMFTQTCDSGIHTARLPRSPERAPAVEADGLPRHAEKRGTDNGESQDLSMPVKNKSALRVALTSSIVCITVITEEGLGAASLPGHQTLPAHKPSYHLEV